MNVVDENEMDDANLDEAEKMEYDNHDGINRLDLRGQPFHSKPISIQIFCLENPG